MLRAYAVNIVPIGMVYRLKDLAMERRHLFEPGLVAGHRFNPDHRVQDVLTRSRMDDKIGRLVDGICELIYESEWAQQILAGRQGRALISELQLTKPGGYVKWHTDHAGGNRILLAVTNLTDRVGGTMLRGGKVEFFVPPQVGNSIIMDPAICHRGIEVEHGERLALTCIWKNA